MNRPPTSSRVSLVCGTAVVFLISGCAAPGDKANSACCGPERPKTLVIRRQRLVDNQNETCGRCGAAERSLDEARRVLARCLKPLDIRVELVKTQLTLARFKRDPSESNRIWVGEEPVDTILGAQTGSSACAGVCGGSPCRTTVVDGQSYETIPAELIIRAGLRVAANLVQPPAPPGACCPTGESPPQSAEPELQPMPWRSH